MFSGHKKQKKKTLRVSAGPVGKTCGRVRPDVSSRSAYKCTGGEKKKLNNEKNAEKKRGNGRGRHSKENRGNRALKIHVVHVFLAALERRHCHAKHSR